MMDEKHKDVLRQVIATASEALSSGLNDPHTADQWTTLIAASGRLLSQDAMQQLHSNAMKRFGDEMGGAILGQGRPVNGGY